MTPPAGVATPFSTLGDEFMAKLAAWGSCRFQNFRPEVMKLEFSLNPRNIVSSILTRSGQICGVASLSKLARSNSIGRSSIEQTKGVNFADSGIRLVANESGVSTTNLEKKETKGAVRSLLSHSELREYTSPEKARNFKIWKSYPELVRSVLGIIRQAKSEIYLASTYYEPIIGSKLVEKFTEGVSLNILDGNPSGTTFVERIREATRANPKNKELFESLLLSPKVSIRTAQIDYSFIVVDRVHCEFEVVDLLNPSEFNMAVQIDDAGLGRKLIQEFESAIARAAEDVEKVPVVSSHAGIEK